MCQVTKRDGRLVKFNKEKIKNAVLSAFKEVDGTITPEAEDLATSISNNIEETSRKSNLSVEDIQDRVEKYLYNSPRFDVAKAFTIYRNDRSRIRNSKSKLMKEIESKLMASSVENQNANIDERSFGGRIGAASDAVQKQYALDNCISKMARENHIYNRIYIHDLSTYAVGMHNCLTLPLDDLLKNGFNTRQTDVRPARSINSAFQLLAVLFQLQSLNQFGGVSASHLDWTMIPYVRISFYKYWLEGLKYIEEIDVDCLEEDYDLNLPNETTHIDSELYKVFPKVYYYAMDKTEKECHQSVEAMYHNLNTLQSRSGNQLPFTSINYGTCTLPEGRMVIYELLNVSIQGIGKLKRTSIFPCGIFQVMEGVNKHEGDPNYDLFRMALKSTSQRLYPNYANVDWSGNAGYDRNDPRTYFATMGCRTANGYDINGFGQLKDGRGNICPVTIIMPTIAMETKLSLDDNDDSLVDTFMKNLEKKIEEAKDMLLERFEYIASRDVSSAKFMYENHIMAGYIPEEGIRSALKHGTLALGQIGLAETLQILIGTDHTTEKGMELAKRIENMFYEKCKAYKEQYKLNFGVYYTPAENLCYTAMTKFKEKFGEIKNVSDKKFFTNSMHVPVWKEMSPFQKIDIESQLTGYSSAGCITYVELDSTCKNNLEGLESIVLYAMDNDIPYFAINVPNDQCEECGYTDEIGESCPVCGNKHIRRLRRVTGYLTGNYTTAFNLGKQEEVEMRVKHHSH